MRKLVLQMQISADGYVSSARPFDWRLWDWGQNSLWDERLRQDFNLSILSKDAIILSRKMIEEGYLEHWSGAAEKHAADPLYAFARHIAVVEKVVLSDRIPASRWERTVVRSGNLEAEVNALKRQPGRGDMIVFGGTGFASALLGADLVDSLQLFVNPAILGNGASIFAHCEPRRLKLDESRAYPCGMLVNSYNLSSPF